MTRTSGLLLVALLTGLLAPRVARAQSAIAGVVKETSGAVLSGVTVEASSDALIEKTRAVITDGSGQYKIVDLRPGAYVVTFTLTGFQTIKREGIDLPAEFTAQINVDMKVGSIEETITVTTAAPVVDVQSASHTQVLSRDDVDNMPTGRTIQGIGQMIVGVSLNLPDVGGSRAAMQTYMSVRGNSAANNTVLVDGMMVNGLELNGAVQSYFNDAMSQEMSYQTSGIDASVSAGGVKLNMIPREGGNRFSGATQISYRPGQWQGNNLTQRLQNAGLTAGNTTDYIYDLGASQGGPISRDKVWFFASARDYRTNNGISNTFFDDGSQGKDYNYIRDALGRVTYQLSSKNRVAGYYDRISKYRGHDMQSLTDPETASLVWTSPNYSTGQMKWTSMMTSRLLLEAGWAFNIERRDTNPQPGIAAVRGSNDWFNHVSQAQQGVPLGAISGAPAASGSEWPERYSYNLALSYITGSHHIKGGINGTYGTFHHESSANGDLQALFTNVNTTAYTTNGGPIVFSNPVAVIARNTPRVSEEALSRDMGLYIQDSWTMSRLTVSAGICYEQLVSGLNETASPAGRFVPQRVSPAKTDLPNWADLAPRLQVVYDVFGNSKTAIRYSANRYNAAQTTTIAAGFNPLASRTQSVNWTDVNGDLIPQMAQRVWNANGTVTDPCVYPSVGCELNTAVQLPPNFGLLSDTGTYQGFPRQYSFEQGVEVQHELLPRLSVTGSYYRGDFRNLTTTINRAITPTDYTAINVFNPETGERFQIYSLSAAASARSSDNLTYVDDTRKSTFDAYSAEFRLRGGRGASLFGGVTWGRSRDNGTTNTTNCTIGRLQDPNQLRFCDEFNLEDGSQVPYATDVRLNGSYPLPWAGLILSATFQSNDGGPLSETYSISRTTLYPDGSAIYTAAGVAVRACPAPCVGGSLVAPALTQASVTPRLRPTAVVRAERLNQIDLKLAKTFAFGRLTIAPNFEVFNLTNRDKVITYASNSYAIPGTGGAPGAYLRPNSIVQGRIIGVGASVRW